ncbi:MAG: hypothetical protein GF329_17605 [Candidatus Lokiarchaeota archaeon]|nr:hypothetical protein [Candidatus Lokiarchaeota archaeon]
MVIGKRDMVMGFRLIGIPTMEANDIKDIKDILIDIAKKEEESFVIIDKNLTQEIKPFLN